MDALLWQTQQQTAAFGRFFYGRASGECTLNGRRIMNQLDPVNVAVALASVIFGQALAGIIGSYAVILIASTVGAAWALGRRDPGARLGAAWDFLRLNATAVLITVGLANVAGRWLGHDDTTWMLAPIALLMLPALQACSATSAARPPETPSLPVTPLPAEISQVDTSDSQHLLQKAQKWLQDLRAWSSSGMLK